MLFLGAAGWRICTVHAMLQLIYESLDPLGLVSPDGWPVLLGWDNAVTWRAFAGHGARGTADSIDSAGKIITGHS